MGRATQGVKVMNIKDDDVVSAVALVVESDTTDDAELAHRAARATKLDASTGTASEAEQPTEPRRAGAPRRTLKRSGAVREGRPSYARPVSTAARPAGSTGSPPG